MTYLPITMTPPQPPIPPPTQKRGAAIPTNASCPANPRDALRLQATWLYDWTTHPPRVPGIESIPMIYGAFTDPPDLGGNSPWLLGANEPNISAQSNLTPSQAATHQRLLESCYPNRRFVSPSCVHNLPFLKRIYQIYQDTYRQRPRWDAIAVHLYHRNVGVSWAYEVLPHLRFAQAISAELWITEFVAPNVNALRYLVERFEAEERITRYAWFAVRYTCTEPWTPLGAYPCTTLVNHATGNLTAFGKAYTECPSSPYLP